jgi:hypothetical protein
MDTTSEPVQFVPTTSSKEKKPMSDPFTTIRNRANLVQVIDPRTPSHGKKRRDAFSTDYAKACGQKAFLTRKARVQG